MNSNSNEQFNFDEFSRLHTPQEQESLCGLTLLDNDQLEILLRLYIMLEEERQHGNDLVNSISQQIDDSNNIVLYSSNSGDVKESSELIVNNEKCQNSISNVSNVNTFQNPFKSRIPEISKHTRRKSIPFICSTVDSIRKEQEIKNSQPKRPRGRPRKNSFEIKTETKRLKME